MGAYSNMYDLVMASVKGWYCQLIFVNWLQFNLIEIPVDIFKSYWCLNMYFVLWYTKSEPEGIQIKLIKLNNRNDGSLNKLY